MLVVEVDRLNAEAAQAGFRRAAHIGRAAVHAAQRRVGRIAQDAELGCKEKAAPTPLERLADQHLVGVRSVDVRRVEEVDAQLERPVDGGQRLLLVASAVELAHAHTTQANG